MRHQKNIYTYFLYFVKKESTLCLNYLMPGGNEKVTRT